MKRRICVCCAFFVWCCMASGESRRVIGTGPGGKVEAWDTARYAVGDWLWMPDAASWKSGSTDPLNGYKRVTLTQVDIDWAKRESLLKGGISLMAGFSSLLPGKDDSGREYMEYRRSDDHTRKVFADGEIEDSITDETTFDNAFEEFKRKYSRPVPRNNNAQGSGINWAYEDDVPASYPGGIFWAAIIVIRLYKYQHQYL